MTIDDMMKQTFDSLEVDTRIYAVFEHQGGMYSGEFKVIWIDKGENCISLTTPNESPYGTCIGVPLKNFFSLVNISKYNKEETTMTDYGRKLEKEYRDGMVVGGIYNFIGQGTHGWKYRYRLVGFEGCGEDLSLIFKSVENDSEFRIMAADMGGFILISRPIEEKSDTLPKPMQLVKKIEGYKFDEYEFYRATGSVRHFLIKNSDNNNRYEALYYGPTLDKTGMHIAFARTVGFGNVNCESAELYHDKIKCDPIMANFKLFKGDSMCTHEEIKIDDIFKREEILEWDIDKLKVGKAYRIQDSEGNEIDGLYTRLYETAVPGQSSIAFTVLSDNRADGAHHVYLGELARGEIKIYELTCRKETDEE